MGLLRWLTATGLRISMCIAFAFVSFHTFGEWSKTKADHELTWLQRMDLVAFDTLFTYRGLVRPERWDVSIAAIDEKSIKELGELPWSRRIHARLVRKLTELDAAAIAFDVMFPYPQLGHDDRGIAAARTSAVSSGLYEAREDLKAASLGLRELTANDSEELGQEVSGVIRSAASSIGTATSAIDSFRVSLSKEIERVSPDEDFAQAIDESKRVVLAVVQQSFEEREKMPAELFRTGLKGIRTSTVSEYMVREDGYDSIGNNAYGHFRDHYLRFFGVQSPTAELLGENVHLGSINAFPDTDGVMRRFYLLARPDDTAFVLPTLALKAVEVAQADSLIEIYSAAQDSAPYGLGIGDLKIDLGEKAKLVVNWYGSPTKSGMPVWSISDLLNDKVSKSEVQGRVVFVAATALGTFDQRVTPLDRNIAGVFTHATLAQNILDGRFLRRPQAALFVEIGVILLLGLLLGLTLIRVSVLGKVIVAIASAFGWLGVNRFVFFDSGWVVSTMVPLVQVFGTLLCITLWRFLIEEREKRKTKQAFQRYLAPAVMEQVLTNPEEFLRLGGRKYEATVLFSDIRGFTTISEKLSPEELGRLLNLYMTPMTNLVFQTGGTLDKYIGDAVMAFWGAPILQADHATRACRTALKMMRKIDDLNENFAKEGLPQIAIGIGLATGPMTIGNMGSDDFFAYTALGDRVNLGARLEGQTKDYGVEVIISEDCYQQARSEMTCRELGSIQVKGKMEPVKIYELLAEGPLEAPLSQFVDEFHAGLKAYRDRRWGDAMRYFERAHGLRPGGDKTSLDYIEQCRAFEINPPPEHWAGVRIALSK